MPLQAPKLDDRRFEDIVSEAKTLIPRYAPAWTDHNESDPGITMIQLFAWTRCRSATMSSFCNCWA
jgi:hypothetical protein